MEKANPGRGHRRGARITEKRLGQIPTLVTSARKSTANFSAICAIRAGLTAARKRAISLPLVPSLIKGGGND
jgi:hypothetical protein